MTQNFNVKTFNDLSNSAAMKRRFEFLLERTTTLNWSLDEISAKLSEELRSKLRQDLANLTAFESVKVASAETLEQWGRTDDPKRPYLGTPIVSNLPVICIGASVTNRNRSILESRGLAKDHPQHVGWMASRLTWGTLYIKTRNVTANDGSVSVGGYTLFVTSNKLLDVFYGPLDKGSGRKPTLWPEEWVRSKAKPQNKKKSNKKPGNRKHKKPEVSAVKLLFSKVKPKWSDPLSKVTLTMVKVAEKELGMPEQSGTKQRRVMQLIKAVQETGDKDLIALLP